MPHPPLYAPTIVVPVTVQNGEVVMLSTYARDEWEGQGTPPRYVTATHVGEFGGALRSGGIKLQDAFAD